MALQVNLLKKSRVLSEKQYQLERKVFISSVIGFVLVVCITIAFFAWQVLVSVRVKQVDATITKVTAQLGGLQTASIQQLYAKTRLKMIGGLFATRATTREALQRVLSISMPGVTISSIAFEQSNLLKISVMADSLQSFDSIYKYFEGTKDFFTNVVNNGVSRSQDGSYIMTLSLYTPKDNTKE